MSIKHLISPGIGFSPGSTKYIVMRGLTSGEVIITTSDGLCIVFTFADPVSVAFTSVTPINITFTDDC